MAVKGQKEKETWENEEVSDDIYLSLLNLWNKKWFVFAEQMGIFKTEPLYSVIEDCLIIYLIYKCVLFLQVLI